jgi:hypothetical protein
VSASEGGEGEQSEQGSDPAPGGGGEDRARGAEALADVVPEAAPRPRADLDPQPRTPAWGDAGTVGVPLLLGDALGEPVHELDAPVGPALEPDPAEGVPEDGEAGPCARFLAVQAQFHLDG